MLRIIQNNSAHGAKSYYTTADYYTEGQELEGIWKGKGAKRLGLSGAVRKEEWDALCDNRNPSTGEVLTPRQKTDRRVGYDMNFHAPKSLSLLYALTQDERILSAFRESVDATMEDMESEMKTRVRKEGKTEDRTSGNMIWGEFVHFTARPVEGIPDPHLHAHCFVMNATWDKEENRWKAGQFGALKRDANFFEAVFHSRLARSLEELGVEVKRTKNGWEIDGVPDSAIKKFSRRTAQIEKEAKDKGITNPEAKGGLGAKTREHKKKDMTLGELREQWSSRLTPDELDALGAVRHRVGKDAIPEDDRIAGEAASRAIEHCFERNSVVLERKLLAEALKRSYGRGSAKTVLDRVKRENLVTGERNGQRFVTTREVLLEEKRMIDFARQGRGTCRPLGKPGFSLKREWLNDGQRRAVSHVLNSPDRVMLLRGRAGTGKTTLMQEAVEAIEANGTKVFTFAPSADASRGTLRKEGFENAETVAKLLVDKELQSEIEGQVIWIDEAGLLGVKSMAQVFDLAEKTNARVILSGDRFQHGSVERGAALRLLEQDAGLIPAEIKEIKRQKDEYKRAVEALSEGRVTEGFRKLDQLGWIKEVPEEERYKILAKDYVSTIEAGKSALIVSPTHREGQRIQDEIRTLLKETGTLGQAERTIPILENANLTEAERKDAVNLLPGDVLVFHQNAKGIRKGQRVVVGESAVGGLPLHEAAKFQVYRPRELSVAPGDILRVTRNGTTLDGEHRLNNGATYTVKAFDKQGNIELTNGWTINRDFGHLTHGYCVTSHTAQGRTVDRVLLAESSMSFPAASKEQAYVSISRGREGATIYTDNKAALLEAISDSDERLTATEFVNGDLSRQRSQVIQRLADLTHEPRAPLAERELVYER